MNSLHFSKFKITLRYRFVFAFVALFLCNFSQINAQHKDFIVVLDAGHGGKDPGKVGSANMKEKDIALNIVLEVGKLLENTPGIKVIYTRKTDVFVELKERGRIANKADADLFVSIHCNAHNTQASGTETWVLGTHANKQNFEVAKAENAVILLEDNYKVNYKGFDPHSPESVIGLTLMQEEYLDQSIQLASILQSEITSKLKRLDRGVKQAGFVVLHQTYMPSVLIETGFITNNSEGTLLNSSEGQQNFAMAIYNGIINYHKQLELNTVTSNNDIVENSSKQTDDKNVGNAAENSADVIYKNVEFKVQIAAGKSKLDTKPYNFNGLNNVEREKVGNTYKYYFGKTSNYSKVEEMQQLAKSKGYKSAFIVAFENGNKVPLEQVLKKS
jgi:N-acetylmuramoyl-L-alanine amidase